MCLVFNYIILFFALTFLNTKTKVQSNASFSVSKSSVLITLENLNIMCIILLFYKVVVKYRN